MIETLLLFLSQRKPNHRIQLAGPRLNIYKRLNWDLNQGSVVLAQTLPTTILSLGSLPIKIRLQEWEATSVFYPDPLTDFVYIVCWGCYYNVHVTSLFQSRKKWRLEPLELFILKCEILWPSGEPLVCCLLYPPQKVLKQGRDHEPLTGSHMREKPFENETMLSCCERGLTNSLSQYSLVCFPIAYIKPVSILNHPLGTRPAS